MLSAWQQPEPVDVLPENWDAVQLFQAAATQWLHNPAGYRTGINYAGLALPLSLLALRGRRAREAFAGLQVLEMEFIRRERQAASRARAGH